MNSYENFKQTFLKDVAKPGMGEERHFQSLSLSQRHGVSEAHVREMLVELASDHFISISAYDGAQVRPWHQWENVNDMFSNNTDGGYFRIKILAAGAELVDDLPVRKIGFVTA